MKKVIICAVSALLAATAVCSMAGCGGDKKESGSTAETTAAQSSSAATDAGSSEGIADEDVVFTYNGVQVTLNSDADAAVAALGEYQEVSSQLSCHGEGDDKTYTYDGFMLNTYPLDGKDMVLEIVVSSPEITTSKGIKIGDTADAVKAAYGDSFNEIGVYYAYKTSDGKSSLQFLIENGTVKEIDYYYDV